MDYDDKQLFYVSSENRVSGTSSNFLYRFDMSNNEAYDHIVVLGASIPKSYYLIASYNDQFTLQEDNMSFDITIPTGNYTLTSFKQILTNILNTYSPHGWIYSVSYPSPTQTGSGKLTFTVEGNGVIQPQFIFDEHVFEQFGFNSGTYSFVDNSLTSVNVINLQLLSALFIHSDMCDNKHDSVLQEIYSNNSDYSNIEYQATAPDAYSKKLAIKGINTYKFNLTDNHGNQVDLNGLNWNMTILLFKKNNIYEMARNFMKLQLLEQQ